MGRNPTRSRLTTSRRTEPTGPMTPSTVIVLDKNRTWSCKAEEDKKSWKELPAIVAKGAKGQVKKELALADKKRKSDDEKGECFLIESLTESGWSL